MKIIRLIVAVLFVTAVASISAFAQGGATKTPATQTPATQTAPATVNVPASKMAIINSAYFGDEKEGIIRYVNELKKLDREFQPRQKELEDMAKRYQALADEIAKLQGVAVADVKAIQAKQEEAQRLERDYKYKQEEYKAALNKRSADVLGPIQQDIGNALEAFAKQRGITWVIDVGVENPLPIFVIDKNTDITKAFIAEYNTKNPGTSASTTTPGTTPTRP